MDQFVIFKPFIAMLLLTKELYAQLRQSH